MRRTYGRLRGASGEEVGGRSPPAPTREVTPFINIQQSRLLLKSTRDNTNSVYIYTNRLSIDCALCKCKADTVLILLPCYVKRKIIFNKMLSVYVNIWNSSDLLNLYTVSRRDSIQEVKRCHSCLVHPLDAFHKLTLHPRKHHTF